MNIQALTSPSNDKVNDRFLNACPPDKSHYTSLSKNTSHHKKEYLSSSQQHDSRPQQNMNLTDLQTVVSTYHENPELLKLILTSKVEEDKRRAEEAKLKVKELDIFFKKHQEEWSTTHKHNYPSMNQQQHRRSSSTTSSSSSSNHSLHGTNIGNKYNNRPTTTTTTATTTTTITRDEGESSHYRNNSSRSIPYPVPTSAVTNNKSAFVLSIPRRNSSASIITTNKNNKNMTVAVVVGGGGYYQASQSSTYLLSSSAPNSSCLSPPSSFSFHRHSVDYNTDNNKDYQHTNNNKISRRRRSMQAITKIVRTSEFPYNDGYFWKNNGNTVQKKTRCRSVYYKCANSSKGCLVNKTVVEQVDGSYIIKYRGEHNPECSKVEHIIDL
ncbi:uncharacterized protein BX663DRAFT_491334 [Cokeromyces recurvatus]|uniref:uncharacterized protein n=1 Tax=Cokeromyces recurvatus TaxID=90255 RepID=UPI00222086AF|nr:uncharacterized protein BX663DRAFT_491334 [Cokeromyces recurvatus]KAI7907566.1 hypothetical protein BX663DRAFT_491334 [Cokeromyces recurvatus]